MGTFGKTKFRTCSRDMVAWREDSKYKLEAVQKKWASGCLEQVGQYLERQ